MPEISRFFGTIIAIFYNDHNPPHFHAKYGEYKAFISIDDRSIFGWRITPSCARVSGGMAATSYI